MGNCIRAAFSHTDEVLSSNKKLSSKATSMSKLRRSSQRGELEHLIQKRSRHSLRLPERVRVVVNKKQFERLTGCVEEVQLRRMVLELLLRRAKKWRPSLAAIPEL